MSEDTKTTEESTEEVKTPTAGEKKPKKEAAEEIFSFRDEKVEEKQVKFNANAPEELPESVKKILEKKKTEKTDNKKKKKKKKVEKKVSVGKAYVKATYNNTIVTLTNLNGDVISWASAGMAGFKGPKKSTPYAAQIITRIAVERAKEVGLQEVGVYVKGVGTGRESAIRSLNASGLVVTYIKDQTPLPHNGCRPKKPRRV
ncbi:MAG: 30S ribosomal protein S11 [Parcubacteria group bacterium GW2011_GWE2_39_37]|uniref:Small ribosomal subunit protein uS11 n=1 Tax=Candidatus Falkowbacteria bacterium GW2011_GWF2_39_8 TaxID=1618642 RepID=A0A0G0PWU9_9BACT|nr:MAG: 30S ribosomal protein S11 [Parcubacteria group bacterium GW2011_GWE2_39_37]KKR32403.1 MAG: 30S ribosomal protein S11 [Candidatus Falkowbacteria bacterium GW2011_GWF2_39_8]